jgi:hypothetical protein
MMKLTPTQKRLVDILREGDGNRYLYNDKPWLIWDKTQNDFLKEISFCSSTVWSLVKKGVLHAQTDNICVLRSGIPADALI